MISTGALNAVTSVAKGLIGLADQAITDKDKRIEFQYKVLDRTYQFYEKILATPTNPKLDAIIKFFLVFGTAFKGILRPVGAFLLTAGVLYLRSEGIEIPEYIEIAMASAFPGWMASRHKEKIEKQKIKQKQLDTDFWDDIDD